MQNIYKSYLWPIKPLITNENSQESRQIKSYINVLAFNGNLVLMKFKH